MGTKQPFWRNLSQAIQSPFSHEGQLKQTWKATLQEQDKQLRLDGLWQTQQIFLQHPQTYAHLYLSFLDDYLAAEHLAELSSSDLESIEKMGEALQGLKKARCSPEEVWQRLLQAYDARKDSREALALLTRMYRNVGEQSRQGVIMGLLQRKGYAIQHIEIYLDYLKHSSTPEFSQRILRYLDELCVADFTTPYEQLKDIYMLARRCHEHNITLSKRELVLGLGTLLIEHTPVQAATHFKQLLQAHPGDSTAQIGLLSALLKLPDFTLAVEEARQISTTNDPIVIALINLSLAICWLEDPRSGGKPPCTARALAEANLSKYVDNIASFTIGRLYLLEGDAQQALQAFAAFSETYSERQIYYKAWANLLHADHPKVLQCYNQMRHLPAAWTLACLLLESNPGALTDQELEQLRATMPLLYIPAMEARIALSRSKAPLGILPTAGGGTIEEEMEQLRSALGVAFYRHEVARMQAAIQTPLFAHLPNPDRQTWQALYALLKGNARQAESLLDEAAMRYRYQRAALLFSVHALAKNLQVDHSYLVDIAQKGRAPGRAALLSGYLGEQSELPTDYSDVPAGNAMHYYCYCKLYLQGAAHAQLAGERAKAAQYRQQAYNLLQLALSQQDQALPADSHILAQCLDFLLSPEQKAIASLNIWEDLQQLAEAAQEPWFLWYALLAQLESRQPALVATASEELLVLLEQAQQLRSDVILELATSVTQTCLQTEKVSQVAKMTELVQYLASSKNLSALQRLYQRCLTHHTRLRVLASQDSTEQERFIKKQVYSSPTNLWLVLLYIGIQLRKQKPAEAIDFLQKIKPKRKFERQLYRCLQLWLSAKKSDTLPSLHDLPKQIPARYYQVLLAATALATQQSERGFELLALILSRFEAEIDKIVDVRLAFACLCAYVQSQRRELPCFKEAALKVSQQQADPTLTAAAARLLAIKGEIAAANQLWQRALSLQDESLALRREWAQFLCYCTAQTYMAGDLPAAIQQLQDTVQRTGQKELRGFSLEQLAASAEMDLAVGRLLHVILPQTSELEERAGRYHFLAQSISQHPPLLQALQSNQMVQIQQEWRTCLRKITPAEISILHGLAVVYREHALAQSSSKDKADHFWKLSTFLWLHLLCSEHFWAYFLSTRIDPESGNPLTLERQSWDKLFQRSLHKILSQHSTAAQQAFNRDDLQAVQIHLHCLQSCSRWNDELRQLLKAEHIVLDFQLDKQKVKQAKDLARTLHEGLYQTWLQEARRRLEDPVNLARQPEKIRMNYEDGLSYLGKVPEAVDPMYKLILLTRLEWYNAWFSDLFQLITTDDSKIARVVEAASAVAEQLIAFSYPDEKHMYLPENQQLATHFLYRGLTSRNFDIAYKYIRLARSWNNYTAGIEELLSLIQLWEQYAVALLAARRGSNYRFYTLMDDARNDFRIRGYNPRVLDFLSEMSQARSLNTSFLVLNKIMLWHDR
ncbi:hypothetical protein EPA93_38140 [Ktedonosporobacter rubrisoli]|uniref:Tetratricopeptide repeat protein n=1 Tax=Ktedonosporobacter rubrisoli TaxID=2509675 RepID=A0A4V0YZZ9_KTERU|nr:hypothetical protein [Ktedonosporobacter rubrisoli]QBD81481.1 hypothetical protein EPA93_38140 [Ktedonosporobacter rubrisoli]